MDKSSRAISEFMQAIGEPNRLRLITALAQGASTVTELANRLNVEVVNTSHHLGVLRRGHVVRDEKHGRFVRYELVNATVEAHGLTLRHSSGASVTIPTTEPANAPRTTVPAADTDDAADASLPS